MSHFLQTYTLSYTPLSPIHIGSGDSYEPANYVIDDGTLYEFDSGGVLTALTEQDRDELNNIVSGRANAAMLMKVQRFFYQRRDELKPWAINSIPVLKGVENYYRERIGKPSNVEGDGSEVIAKLAIDRTAINPVTRQPVLFGSSIKGAIRTALLDHVNAGRSLTDRDADLFRLEGLRQDERKRREREQRNVFPRLNQRLLGFRAGHFELDPLRLLQIGDAAYQMRDSLPAMQVYLSVNRKKELKRDKHGKEIFSQAEGNENLCRRLECSSAWRYRAFSGRLNLQNLADIEQSEKLPNPDSTFTIRQIAQYCNDHYRKILDDELEAMRKRGFLDAGWDRCLQTLLDNAADKFAQGRAFLVRVGRHSGAEAVTLDGVRHIKIMKGNPEYQPHTKTLWLAAETKDQRENLLPFGWLLVEIHPGDGEPADWPELAELCAAQQGPARQWAEKQARQQAETASKRQADEQRRQQEEIARQQRQAEEQAAAQAAEQARLAEQQRLAQLSPIELEFETLLKSLPPAEHDTALLRELENGRWQGEDAKIVAQKIKALMEQARKWMPDFAGDNKQKVKLKQRSQKVCQYLQD
ncbi:RAMP superfamily CRISPR-associated protein [Methylomicrobium sp. RS1]|uniref:RAMP superfamily CRISPR-associated protein n=1 Tax=Candidatus Methylomicrobium oryzae TaxID=2802053 RepID=UPI001920FBF9|nr:RAMP superfamily CRISPR-associated protein [Methylomicrobium sp. RS1]MBL1266001.1 hypothetical protein [Methylomicrobium sp. RS1]